MKTKTVKTDVKVENHGTIILFSLYTREAERWVDENVDVADYMWMGRTSFGCEHRYAQDLAQGMREAGLSVS